MCTVKVVLQLPDEAAGILTAGCMARLQAKEWQNFSSWMAEQELGPEYGEELLALLAEVVQRFNTPAHRQLAHCRLVELVNNGTRSHMAA